MGSQPKQPKPVDPIREMVKTGLREFTDHVELTLKGLPAPHWLWRELLVGEATRQGDYCFTPSQGPGTCDTVEEQCWVPANADRTVLAGDVVWRPLGPFAKTWYVGASGCSPACHLGTIDQPYDSVEEASQKLPPNSVGVVRQTGTNKILLALDPDGEMHLYEMPVSTCVDEVIDAEFVDIEEDNLRKILMCPLTPENLATDEAREAAEVIVRVHK